MPNGCNVKGNIYFSKDKIDEVKKRIDFEGAWVPNYFEGDKLIYSRVRGNFNSGEEKEYPDFIQVSTDGEIAWNPIDLQNFLRGIKANVDHKVSGELFYDEPNMGFTGVMSDKFDLFVIDHEHPGRCKAHADTDKFVDREDGGYLEDCEDCIAANEKAIKDAVNELRKDIEVRLYKGEADYIEGYQYRKM